MKKKLIVGMVMGMLAVGALSASAADSCGKCVDRQLVQQFTRETELLNAELQAKASELRQLTSYAHGNNYHRQYELEREIRALKDRINSAAGTLGIPGCCRS